MLPDNKRPEREETDASLRAERVSSDLAIAEKLASTEESADGVLDRARQDADAVLRDARELADRTMRATGKTSTGEAKEVLARERAQEDDAVERERGIADDMLRVEREEQARVLASLFPLERDKTDRHLLTERARSDDALASRDDFLGIVSHDLRNLLGGIVLSANLLADMPPAEGDDGGRRVAARIQRYAARMNRLIGDLIDVASIDAGRLAMSPEAADAAVLIDEAVETFAPAAAEKGISLVTDHGAAPLLARFDHDRLLQVLANLVSNSLKFTPRGGVITVGGALEGGQLHLSVRDTGTGIPADMTEAVFERFWQVGKNDRRGLGLGLYISRCIVESHGGRIRVDSVPGKGCALHFTIPR